MEKNQEEEQELMLALLTSRTDIEDSLILMRYASNYLNKPGISKECRTKYQEIADQAKNINASNKIKEAATTEKIINHRNKGLSH